MRRRALLSISGAVGLSGCTFGSFGDEEMIRLGVIEFENYTNSERGLEVEIRADGESADEVFVQVPVGDPYGHVRLERLWPEQARSYSIRIQSDIEPDPLTISVTESYTETCETFKIRLRTNDIVPYRASEGRCYDGQAPSE